MAHGGQGVEQAEETQQLADGAGAGAVEEVVEDSWQLLGKFHIGDAGDLQLQLCFSLHHSFSLFSLGDFRLENGIWLCGWINQKKKMVTLILRFLVSEWWDQIWEAACLSTSLSSELDYNN